MLRSFPRRRRRRRGGASLTRPNHGNWRRRTPLGRSGWDGSSLLFPNPDAHSATRSAAHTHRSHRYQGHLCYESIGRGGTFLVRVGHAIEAASRLPVSVAVADDVGRPPAALIQGRGAGARCCASDQGARGRAIKAGAAAAQHGSMQRRGGRAGWRHWVSPLRSMMRGSTNDQHKRDERHGTGPCGRFGFPTTHPDASIDPL